MRIFVFCIIVFSSLFSTYGQGKRTVMETGVTSKTEWKFKYDDGDEIKFKETEVCFDKKGNILMEKIFDEDGKVLSHLEFKYDENDNIIVETTYNNKGKVVKREEYKYQGNLKIEKKTFDVDGKLKSKKIYEYKYN